MQSCGVLIGRAPSDHYLEPVSPHPNSPPAFPRYSTMPMSSTKPLLPHQPTAPVAMPVAIDCDPAMPVLSLPTAIGTTKNGLLPTTSSRSSVASTPNLQHPQTQNPVSIVANRKQHFPMTVTFHPSQGATEPNPTHHHTLPERIPVPNATRERALPSQSPVLSAYMSGAQAQELNNVDCASSEAAQ